MLFFKIWFIIFFINLTYVVLFQKQAKPLFDEVFKIADPEGELKEASKIIAILLGCAFSFFGPFVSTYRLIVYKNPFHQKNS